MKSFFYTGTNPKNKSGVSWKIWKIEQRGRTITFFWGPALIQKRRVLPVGVLQSRKRVFPTIQSARDHEEQRISEQMRKGYKRMVRRRVS
jgi:hypothetical protein